MGVIGSGGVPDMACCYGYVQTKIFKQVVFGLRSQPPTQDKLARGKSGVEARTEMDIPV
jgi:hypothetical protein